MFSFSFATFSAALNLYETDIQVTCGTLGLSTATVKLIDADGNEHVACSVGTGPVDSAYKAVDLIVKVWCYLYISFVLLNFLFDLGKKMCSHKLILRWLSGNLDTFCSQDNLRCRAKGNDRLHNFLLRQYMLEHLIFKAAYGIVWYVI